MTRTEMAQILTMLSAWYPNAAQFRGGVKATVEAWWLVLGDYAYGDVKNAAVAWNTGPKGRYCPDARELIPAKKARTETDRPPDRTYTGGELNQAWRQNCWAFDHNGLVPDGWEPDDELLTRMEAFA